MPKIKDETYKTKSGLVFVNVPMTEDLRERVDRARGELSRSEFIRSLIIKATTEKR